MNCLTGREQNRIPKNKITNRRKTAKRKIHLNLRQMINFMVLQGCVNQKNDVSGRLFIGDKKNNSIQMYIHTHAYQCWNISYFGWSSLGFMFGSSLPFPVGLSCISFSSTISSVISTFPCKIFELSNKETQIKKNKKQEVCWGEQLTPSTCFPSCSFTHGHQPRTAFWEKSDLGIGFFMNSEFGIPGSICRLHFSGLLAGGIKLRRSSSTEPLGEIK